MYLQIHILSLYSFNIICVFSSLYAVVNVRTESNKKSTIEFTLRFRSVTFSSLCKLSHASGMSETYLTKSVFIYFRCRPLSVDSLYIISYS